MSDNDCRKRRVRIHRTFVPGGYGTSSGRRCISVFTVNINCSDLGIRIVIETDEVTITIDIP